MAFKIINPGSEESGRTTEQKIEPACVLLPVPGVQSRDPWTLQDH